MNLESLVQDLIKAKDKSFFSNFCRTLLLGLSYIYKAGVILRNKAYDSKIFGHYRPPVPMIISIGNIVAGGTGKTPATILVAEEFLKEFKVAVLSRGYRSLVEKEATPVVLSQGKGPMHNPDNVGDEPFLIANQLKDLIVIVGKNRHEASNMAAKLGAKLIILDDGMQHRQLARDLEIVLIDANDPFGGGHFLPRGYLRDEVRSLLRADLIILNHVKSEEHFIQISKLLKQESKAKIVGSVLKPTGIYDLNDQEIDSLEDKKVAIFCAIAKPEKFKKTVLDLKAIVQEEYFISDHYPFDPTELEKFANDCRVKGIEFLVCTEKDKVKLPKNLKLSLPVCFVKTKLEISFGQDEWKKFVKIARSDIIRRM